MWWDDLRKNQRVSISIHKDKKLVAVTQEQEESTPGVYKVFRLQKGYSYTAKVTGPLLTKSKLWIAASWGSNATMHFSDTESYTYTFSNYWLTQIKVGVLFSGAKLGDTIQINNIELKKGSSCNQYLQDGYTDKFSYHPHEAVKLFLNGKSERRNIKLKLTTISGQEVTQVPVEDLKVQSIYRPTSNKFFRNFPSPPLKGNLWESYGYAQTCTISLQELSLTPGFYILDGKIFFIIKSSMTSPPKKISILFPSNTEVAYNLAGGKSLYYSCESGRLDPKRRAMVVGTQRPFPLLGRRDLGVFFLWYSLGPFHQDSNYFCDYDLDTIDISKVTTKVFIIAGHSEYWSERAKQNLRGFIAQGGNTLVLSGNTMWWRIAYLEEGKKVICIKDKADLQKDDSDRRAEVQKYELADKYAHTICYSKTNDPRDSAFELLGVEYSIGGYGKLYQPYKDKLDSKYHVVNKSSKLLADIPLRQPWIKVHSLENDGIGWDKQLKRLDSALYKKYRYKNLVMQGDVIYGGSNNKTGIIALRETEKTGTILNFCAMDWCSNLNFSQEAEFFSIISRLTYNAISILLEGGDALFS